jgi:hypothetical protein
MSGPDFNPHSIDANLARIFEKLDAIQSTCVDIKAEAKKTNGRVTSLERWRDISTAKIGVISTGVAGLISIAFWALKTWLG